MYDRPEPLTPAAVLTTAVGSVLAVCTSFGVLAVNTDQQRLILAAVGSVVTVAGMALTAWRTWRAARAKVTPLSDPIDNAGRPLWAGPTPEPETPREFYPDTMPAAGPDYPPAIP
jgi:hypothetical protein